MLMIAANLIDFAIMEILGSEEYSKNLNLHACKILSINLCVYICILVILQKLLK